MNTVSIIGRLTAKPELRHTNSGKSVCSFSVAKERKFKDADGNAIVDYFDCVAWNAQADFLCKWFDKGVRVGITGELQTRTYEKDGQPRKVVEVRVNEVEFAGGKRDANANTSASPAENTNSFADANTDTDEFIPLGDDAGLPWES